MTVAKPPPIKPSHVFFGLNWINGVLPKKNPNMYAMTSLQTIIITGTTNQIIPKSKKNVIWMTIVNCSFITFENVLNDQITLSNDYQKSNMSPCEQTKLLHVVFFDETQHKPYESDAVKTER